jgi:prepilin-type N-terminal cleavage/methylation domain-containing protein
VNKKGFRGQGSGFRGCGPRTSDLGPRSSPLPIPDAQRRAGAVSAKAGSRFPTPDSSAFTLIEVLVALAVVALIAVAALHASSAALRMEQRADAMIELARQVQTVTAVRSYGVTEEPGVDLDNVLFEDERIRHDEREWHRRTVRDPVTGLRLRWSLPAEPMPPAPAPDPGG